MIEAVARRYFEEATRRRYARAERSLPSWESLREEERANRCADADAFLTSIREPSQEMVKAAARTIVNKSGRFAIAVNLTPDLVRACLTEAIDAAIGEAKR